MIIEIIGIIHFIWLFIFVLVLLLISILLIWGSVFNCRHPSPRRDWKGGWELRARSHFAPIGGVRAIRGIRGIVPEGHLLFAGCILESHLLGIGHPILSKAYYMPSWSKGCPKGPKRNPKSAQGEKRGSKDTQSRPTNHQIYTHKQNIPKLPIHRHTAAG